MDAPLRQTLALAQDALLPLGLDLVAPLNQAWLPADLCGPWLKGPRPPADALALVIGNTQALWPRFRAHLDAHPEAQEAPDPLDDYVEGALRGALGAVAGLAQIAYAHARGPEVVPIQRIAVVAGLGALSPGHLLIHPTYGPWISLRAVALFDLPGPAGSPPEISLPCAACAQACAPAFEAAHAGVSEVSSEDARRRWQAWLKVRDACPLGRAHRFPEDAIRYHYAGERSGWGGA